MLQPVSDRIRNQTCMRFDPFEISLDLGSAFGERGNRNAVWKTATTERRSENGYYLKDELE